MDIALHAKAAADIAGDDADAAFRDMQDLMRQDMAHTVHVLCAAIESVAAGAGIVLGNAAARLHCDGGDAVVVEREPRNVMRPGKGGVDRIDIAQRIVKEVLLAAPSWSRGASGPIASSACTTA